ncbi:efflux RND transporter periplasmic adaptor subunit [Sedimenticola sp.]|uniref:efflux RND transporter periplasmic adaptor subunit n=1 Tax=Sedimenticola sp. TaxID=1940285 RepID=UPI003D0CDF92
MNSFKKCRLSCVVLLLMTLVSLAIPAYAEGGYDEHEAAKGPNGGKLLHDGDLTLELAIFERGVPPEFHAWIAYRHKPVDDATLMVTLTRLGGLQDTFNFGKADDAWIGDGVVKEPHSFDVSAELQWEGKTYHWQWESHEGRVEIKTDMAEKVGIETQVAGPGVIERHLKVFGRLVTPPAQHVSVRARFPGLITQIRVDVGDTVKKGDVLAVIESNESLQSYQVRAPIHAVVQGQMANVGETTGEMPLFTLINNDRLWAELKIFPSQRFEVKPGQAVHVVHNAHQHDNTIASMTPANADEPYVLARVSLDNSEGEMAPGDLVSTQIDAERIQVPLAVDNRALQHFRDGIVVFIQVGDQYEIRPLALGRTDGKRTEVLTGLNPGDRYVVENSYLIKADIEKSGASHHH